MEWMMDGYEKGFNEPWVKLLFAWGADQFNAEWMLEGLQRRLIHCTIE